MKYVKELLSGDFKNVYGDLRQAKHNFRLEIIDSQTFENLQNEIIPKLRALIRVSRLIMNMEEISIYLLPYQKLVELEKELCKPLSN